MRTLLLPVLIGLPLAAQLDSAEVRFLQSLKRSAQPYLLIFENESKPIMPSMYKIFQEEAIADLGLVQMTLAQSRAELISALKRRFGLVQGTRWAVVDSSEQCLLSGTELPTAEHFVQQLASKGIQSPIRVLREFLKSNPEHLEARIALLHLQLKTAGRRTRTALDLEIEDQQSNVTGTNQGAEGAIVIRARGNNNNEVLGRPKHKPIPKDKTLDNLLDIQIWGGYADSFDRLLTGDDWVLGGLDFEGGIGVAGVRTLVATAITGGSNLDLGTNAVFETCSPLVKGLYKRKIGQVEAALERAPTNSRLWSVWIRMADAIGDRSIHSVVDFLVQRPGGSFSSWPSAVRSKLIDEARTKNKWDYVADYLWSEYESNPTMNLSVSMSSDSPNFRQNEAIKRFMDERFSSEWDTLFDPLLETLIHMNDLERADTIMNALRERQQQGQWSEAQMLKAIVLANRCNRPDIAQRWSGFLTNNKGSE